MKLLKTYVGEFIHLELVGKKEVSGVLIDFGSDVLVLRKQDEFYYIPLIHIREIRLLSKEEADSFTQFDAITAPPLADKLSLIEILRAAEKGIFVELNVTAHQPVHGHITHVMNDYIVFFSPVYQTMIIPLQHIKWLIPYPASSHPYGFSQSIRQEPNAPVKLFARTLDKQIESMQGAFITCNIGDKESMSGKLIHKETNFLDLMTVKEQDVHVNVHHIKAIAYR
ncbi:hypothetical protein [Domibacillus aminovorans]|uniref:DUF2642 domain-containing protein n=1 Tax=Domibacillus aminovorans TaxID=29332 RepID=A0A177L908_9BACI|nr:hypothetical protein [Domibacillus aminovorans]OAH61121.1 hypothetical protein AWH49_02200 [Domibacillus aminovorans]